MRNYLVLSTFLLLAPLILLSQEVDVSAFEAHLANCSNIYADSNVAYIDSLIENSDLSERQLAHLDIVKGIHFVTMFEDSLAKVNFDKGERYFSISKDTSSLMYSNYLTGLGLRNRYIGNWPDAKKYFLNSISIQRAKRAKNLKEFQNSLLNSTLYGTNLYFLGNIYYYSDIEKEVEPILLEAKDVIEKSQGVEYGPYESILYLLISHYSSLGQIEKTEDVTC